MSCSAKIPIYAFFAGAFFAGYRAALVMMSLYLVGILLGVLSGLVMNKTVFKGAPVPFVMELPNYRFPSVRTTLLLLWDKAKDFIRRGCTVIFIATIIVWFLRSFDLRFNYVDSSAESMLAAIGRGLGVIFAPLGFKDWRVATGLISGFVAKEAVISTLAVLVGSSGAALGDVLQSLFVPLSAYSFLIFTLLYTPCVAAVATVRRELGSLKGTFFIVLYQTGFAWLVAFVVYQVGRLIVG
jgi:ferrous iron transport protein B